MSFPAPHAPWELGDPCHSMYRRGEIQLPANRTSVEPWDRSTAAWRFGQSLGDEGMREYIGVYCGLVSMMDACAGRVLDALRLRGLDRNTLVIFTADHGDVQGGRGMYDKTSYAMYKETTRIPLIVSLPGKIGGGKIVATHAGSCDIAEHIGWHRDSA